MMIRSDRSRERGFTLAEVLVVVAVSTVVLLICYGLVEDAMKTSLFVESHNDLAQLSQRPVNFIQNELYQSRTIFDNDSAGVGTAYLGRMNTAITAQFPSLAIEANYQLPITDASGVLGPDTGTGASRFTGNVLLAVRQLPPVLVLYDHDNDSTTAKVNFPIDRYRFEMYYLSENTSRKFSTAGYYLDLIQARSIDFADYFQLNPLIGSAGSFMAAQKTDICNGLTANGLQFAWDPTPGLLPSASFYSITLVGATAGTMTAYATASWPTGAGSTAFLYSAKSLLPELRGGSTSGRINYTVGFRPSSTTVFPVRTMTIDPVTGVATGGVNPIPRWAVYDSSIPKFPNGFEVKIVGSGASRKVLVRLVLFANYGVTKMDWQEGFVISAD